VVTANLTDQTAIALNQTFVLDSYLMFLKGFALTIGLCYQTSIPPAPSPPTCASLPFFGAPPLPAVPYIFYLKWSQTPLAGLDLIRQSLPTLSNLLYMALGSFLVQLTFINIFLYIWPFLIFFGLVLRGIYFLRKTGGLLIAIAIGALLFYPTVFGIEYLGANNPTITQPQINAQTGVSFQQSPNLLTFCGSSSYEYPINFFVLPSIQGIAQDCHCWPSWGIFGSEMGDVAAVNQPFFLGAGVVDKIANTFTGLLSGITGQPATTFGCSNGPSSCGTFDLSSLLFAWGAPSCSIGTYAPAPNGGIGQSSGTDGGEGTIVGVTQAYGLIGVTAYFLPIINILITLAAIRGLSGLLGGDVNIAGLSRFV
jgi:hypothetical protein